MINELIQTALKTAEADGAGERIKKLSFTEQVLELFHYNSELASYEMKKVFETLIEIRIDEDVKYTLDKLQFERRKHQLLDPIHAIQFAITTYECPIEFLRCWSEGDWAGCNQWPDWRKFQL